MLLEVGVKMGLELDNRLHYALQQNLLSVFCVMLGIAQGFVRKKTVLYREMPTSHYFVGGHCLTHTDAD
jgi:hypothetical protein